MRDNKSAASAKASASLVTRPFVLLCAAMFLGYANQWVLTPTIPLYVDAMGGSAFLAGLALLAFSVPSFGARPFVGRLADKWSAVGVLAVGLVLLAFGSLLFLIPLFAMLFIAGIIRGLGWAGINTGGYTSLAMTAPAERRGEAAGYYTSVTASANIFFPALGLWIIAGHGGFELVFWLSAGLAALGLPIALRLDRHSVATAPPHSAQDTPTASLIDRSVLLATGLNLCSTLANPAVMAFLPLYARSLGIENIGLFYILAGVTNIVIRPMLGKWSDAFGRGPSIAIGQGAQLIGLVLILVADALPLILIGGVFFALSSALIGSSTTALAMDLSNPHRRGQAMATYSISYQMGVGLGSILAGAIADLVSLAAMYVGSIVITIVGMCMLAHAWKSFPRPVR